MCNLLGLAFPTEPCSLNTHPGCCIWQSGAPCFLLWRGLALYRYTTIYATIHSLQGIRVFQFLSIPNQAAVSVRVQVFMCTCFHIFRINALQCNYLVVWQLLIHCFKGTVNCFPEKLCQFIVPLATHEWWIFSSS